MKKFLLTLLTLLCVTASTFGLTACGGTDSNVEQGEDKKPPAQHTHSYDKKVTEQKYLKSEATCQRKAEYYYSCECGEKGQSTFEYGELAEHRFVNYFSDNNATCVKDGTETAKCETCTETKTREVADSKTNHRFENYIPDNNATCLKDGTETAKCETCTETKTRDIENTKNHILVDGVCKYCQKKFSDGIKYQLNFAKTEYYVSGIGTATDTDLYVLDIYNGLPVKGIGDSAFLNCTGIKSVIIPNGVESIGYCSFDGCTALESIVIPDSVTFINDRAFNACSSLKEVDIPCIERIGILLFNGCSSLQTVKISEGAEEIGRNAFKGCSSLTNIKIPDSVKSVASYAFDGCDMLIKTENSVKYVDNWVVGFVDMEYATLKSDTRGIADLAFHNCFKLQSITLPDSVRYFGSYAFDLCSSLKNINFEGSKAQWEAIEKVTDWNSGTGNYTVHCTDGDIAKS